MPLLIVFSPSGERCPSLPASGRHKYTLSVFSGVWIPRLATRTGPAYAGCANASLVPFPTQVRCDEAEGAQRTPRAHSRRAARRRASNGWQEKRSGYIRPESQPRDGYWEVQFVTPQPCKQWRQEEGLSNDASMSLPFGRLSNLSRNCGKRVAPTRWETKDDFWAVLELQESAPCSYLGPVANSG